MNTITEPRLTNKVMEPTEAGPQGPKPKAGLGELWLAILALVAVVAIGVAVAVGAFDSSSETDTVTVVDPRADADSHREPSLNQGMDSETAREINQRASQHPNAVPAVDPRLDADSHRPAPAKAESAVDSDAVREINQQASKADAPHYENGGLSSEEFWEVYGDDTDPREDADHHREANS